MKLPRKQSLLKIPFRLIALIGALMLSVVNVIAIMLLHIESFIIGPLMFFILGCGIYTAVKHAWNQTLILFIIETACVWILFASCTVLFLMDEGREALFTFATRR